MANGKGEGGGCDGSHRAFMKYQIPIIRNRVFRLFYCAVLVAVLWACGIQNVPYLYPPESFTASGNQLSLTHNMENYYLGDSSFKGYEIYYQAFDTLDSANSLLTQIAAASTTISTLETHGMQRMALETAPGTSPLISVPLPNSAHSFTVNVSGLTDWTISENEIGIGNVVRSTGNNGYKSFQEKSGYVPTDSDYAGYDNNPSTVYFVFAALASGIDSAEAPGLQIYSSPIVISTIISI